MLGIPRYLLWSSLFLITYTYVLYPILLFCCYCIAQVWRDLVFLARGSERRCKSEPENLPSVGFLVPAYNEEACLREKIQNLLHLQYPAEKLDVLFVSDGSTDATNEILTKLPNSQFRAIILDERKGKANALNQAVANSTAEILVFSDTSTMFDPAAILNLVRHFRDVRVGVVCGRQQLQGNDESRQTEGVYWKYEGVLRSMEARFGATLTADGAIFALRRECYRGLTTRDILDDFLIPLNARKLKYRVVYDPEAVAVEIPAATIQGQFTRRVRIATGSFRALREVVRTPLPPFTFWAFISHKLLRWLVPFFLVTLLLSNFLLLREPVFRGLFVAQFLFYMWAGLGFVFRRGLLRVRFALVGYFLLAMNVAFLVGFVRSLKRQQSGTWERVS